MYLCVRATLLSPDYFVRSTLNAPKRRAPTRYGTMKRSNPSNDRFLVTTLRTNVDHDTMPTVIFAWCKSDIGLSIVDCVKTSCKSTSCRKLVTCRKVHPLNSCQDLCVERKHLAGPGRHPLQKHINISLHTDNAI